MADAPITFDPAEFQGIVADATQERLSKLNGKVTITADVLDELKEVAAEAIEEAQKLDAAEKALEDAYAADQSDKATYDKGVQEAKDALEAAQNEYDRREKELLARLEDILAKILGIGGEDGERDDDDWNSEPDPRKSPEEPNSPGDSPSSDSPSSDSPGDSPSSDTPAQTQLSADTATPTQQQAYPNVTPQQAQQQQQPAGMSPSMGMPQSQSPSSSLSSPRPRSDKDKDTRKDSDIDRGVLPVAAPVATPVPIDRGTSGTGITNRDVSGKPSTSLSTSGQVPGSVNGQNPRGGVGGGMVGGGAPIGAGSKSDTAGKRSSGGKRFDIESLFTKDDDQSVNSGTLSKDSLAAADKAREAEEDRMRKAMRDSVKRMMTDKKAG